ncbi:hypothetical protein [Chryseobacterium sp. JV274]|uniref:hypothetical protein n=1 Tax=Chryseobacterium sp. JV274 TaxID=1932669 RepID=UPI0015C285E5|nr:hypothetical protein [Chryseobacterium sp. JV274]CAD0220330.1 conserved protein of unknown function [Chryseobacterium sp. JV274]
MKTPIQDFLLKSRGFNANRPAYFMFVMGNSTVLINKEKELIIKTFIDALKDSDLSKQEKEKRAEKYYIENYVDEK